MNWRKKIQLAIAVLTLAAACGPGPLSVVNEASARSSSRSHYCSMRARSYADRHTGRSTAVGAVTGATIGGISRGRNSSMGRGALIGGGAGLIHGSSRWNSLYHSYYRNCVHW